MTNCGKQFSKCLNQTNGEREVHAFLKKQPQILHNAFVSSFKCSRVVSEFFLGSKFRADFVVMAPYSGAWEIHFIELEPVNALLFNKDDTPKQALKKAVAQIDCWKSFCEAERKFLVGQLSDACRDLDLVSPENNGVEPTCTAGLKMTDPRTNFGFEYHIIIGRRAAFSESELQIKTSFLGNHGIDIASYDRLLEAANQI